MSSDHSPAMPTRPLLRSLLFLPATKIEWLANAETAGADAAILDLEDAVPDGDKVRARSRVVEALQQRATAEAKSPPLFVRTNPLESWDGAEEMRTVVRAGLAGLVLPKVRCAHDVRVADELLGWCEREQNLPTGTIALVPLLETARSLREAYEIAAATPRVAYLGALTTSGGDIERAIGYRWSAQGTETLVLRSRVLLDARAAGTSHPVTGLWTHIDDLAGLRSFAEQNRSLGYEGMMAIHPSHIPVINDVFSPTPEELARYARLITAVEDAQATGKGAASFEGEMVDEAMAQTARHILHRYAPEDA